MKSVIVLLEAALLVGFVSICFAQETTDNPINASKADSKPQQPKFSKSDLQFFESSVRPILVERCYECHSLKTNTAEGGLRLDSREAVLRGGSGGPAVVPGDPKSSLLIRAVEYHDSNYAMPPEDAGGKLSTEQIAILTKWVKNGLADPRRDDAHLQPTATSPSQAKSWWSYQPIQKSAIPAKVSDWAWNDIDRFIEHDYQKQNVAPVLDAAPEALLRRLYFDLVGLPPRPEQQAAFLSLLKSGRSRREAIEIVVDQLLDSDQFGAQWGRHWLDVARYAESSGRDRNIPYNHAWRYRDYVIDAWNHDKPFDQFLVEQIAGDQLPAKDDSERARNLVATGFLALGSRSVNEQNPKQFAVDQADEQVDAVFQATMATTFACARCHDHKFEPISQAEYTAVAGIFLSTETFFGAGGGPQARNSADPIDLPINVSLPVAVERMSKEDFDARVAELAKLRSQIIEALDAQAAQKKKAKKGDGKDKDDMKPASQADARKLAARASELELMLSAYDSHGNPKPQAMGVMDKPLEAPKDEDTKRRYVRFLNGNRPSAFAKVDDSPFFARGDIGMPGAKVPRSVPQLFGNSQSFSIPHNSSGRMELARWIISRDNPLTSRVAVNRVWHWMIGQGIVTTVDNFGTTGAAPSHPELLDYLATELMQNHWSMKALIRQIATSRTYQLSSITHNTENPKKDPENALCWRANGRRLQAEEIRDAMLAACGTLDPKWQLATTMAKHNSGKINIGPGRKRAKGEVLSDDVCRSIYLPLPRSEGVEMLELFDLPDAAAVQGAREATNVPSQALYLLNNSAVATQATILAKDAIKQFPGNGLTNFDRRLTHIYERILCRKPNSDEERFARKMLIDSAGSETGWVSIVRGLFATAEFRYLD